MLIVYFIIYRSDLQGRSSKILSNIFDAGNKIKNKGLAELLSLAYAYGGTHSLRKSPLKFCIFILPKPQRLAVSARLSLAAEGECIDAVLSSEYCGLGGEVEGAAAGSDAAAVIVDAGIGLAVGSDLDNKVALKSDKADTSVPGGDLAAALFNLFDACITYDADDVCHFKDLPFVLSVVVFTVTI